ncbi:CCA tRNA nucleotidyltransferase [Aneurinibacillus terranovensis]|uniref:CCA tRNA nucleotidyltransferase n=1 Tax=Aneurinibacillus terranovensis TaxID=278991 RepID=UPI0003FB9D6E|nr:CCA tRNA nucleotidyltransferase [Aneurinibacillus terranovensis]
MKGNVIRAGTRLLETLEHAGYTAYFVGGYVRDFFLNRPVNDLDVATSAAPEEVMKLFERVVPTGLAHGTVTVLMDGIPIEVTTYRTETGYADYRRPDQVKFVTSIEEDLARRDFTINAMAMDVRGKLVDPYNGKCDLRRRQIRAVGEANERFAEDALRMFRALRFASQLSFEIEAATMAAIADNASLISHIAVERIRAEWHKLIMGTEPESTIILLAGTGLAAHIPGLSRLLHTTEWIDPSEGKRTVTLREWSDLHVRWAVLLLLSGTGNESTNIMRALRCENKLIKKCKQLIHLVMNFAENTEPVSQSTKSPAASMTVPEEKALCILLTHAYEEVVAAASVYDRLIGAGGRSSPCGLEPFFRQRYETMAVKNISSLAVSGADLQRATGRSPGMWISRVLLQLALDVNTDCVANTADALLARARMMVNEYT